MTQGREFADELAARRRAHLDEELVAHFMDALDEAERPGAVVEFER